MPRNGLKDNQPLIAILSSADGSLVFYSVFFFNSDPGERHSYGTNG